MVDTREEEAGNENEAVLVPMGPRPTPPVPGIRQLAREAISDAVGVITSLMRDPKTPAAVRLAAANALLDRVGSKMAPRLDDPRMPAHSVLSSEELGALAKFKCVGGYHRPRDFLIEEQTEIRIRLRCECGSGYLELSDGMVSAGFGVYEERDP